MSLYTASPKALRLLKDIEELSIKPYDDQTGEKTNKWVKGATIGYGHLIIKTDWEKYKNGITEAEAEALFKQDLAPFSRKVKDKVTANIAQNEFDALVILVFNIGQTGFSKSSLLKLLNNHRLKTVG